MNGFFLILTVPHYIHLYVEIFLEAIFQSDALAVGILRDCEVEQPLVDDFMVIVVMHAVVVEINLQGEQRKLQRLCDEGKGLRSVLLLKQARFFPAVSNELFLQ